MYLYIIYISYIITMHFCINNYPKMHSYRPIILKNSCTYTIKPRFNDVFKLASLIPWQSLWWENEQNNCNWPFYMNNNTVTKKCSRDTNFHPKRLSFHGGIHSILKFGLNMYFLFWKQLGAYVAQQNAQH